MITKHNLPKMDVITNLDETGPWCLGLYFGNCDPAYCKPMIPTKSNNQIFKERYLGFLTKAE
jgi:hypothetical protein